MRTNRWRLIGMAFLVASTVAGAAVAATPDVNGAIVIERVFNDCPGSTLTVVNDYPWEIMIQDVGSNCYGWANLHVWRMAYDGAEVLFPNDSAFRICGNLTITGDGAGEAGLQIGPWWSEADGRFQVRSTDGEIACWGGRLPFFSFTATFGVTYVKGNTINLCMTYLPGDLDESNPGTIQYQVFYDGMFYSSGRLPFDEGNPSEPYGLWGILDDAKVGGFFQPLWALGGNPNATIAATFNDICWQDLYAVPTEESSWGQVKSLYRD